MVEIGQRVKVRDLLWEIVDQPKSHHEYSILKLLGIRRTSRYHRKC